VVTFVFGPFFEEGTANELLGTPHRLGIGRRLSDLIGGVDGRYFASIHGTAIGGRY
jgi:hypothetical protein